MAAPQRDFGKVVLWMAGSLLSFCALAMSIRALQQQLTVFEMLALRNIGGFIILGAMALIARDPSYRFASRRPLLHIMRNILHSAGQMLWAYGITLLPLALVFAIEFTTPAWVALFAVMILSERMTTARLAALILGFIGVMIILRPGLEGFRPAALLVAVAAVCFSIQQITTKMLTGIDSTWTILFWMNLVQLPLNLAVNAAVGQPVWFLGKLDSTMALPVAGIMIAGFTAHYCLTNAFRHGDALVVTPIDFMRVPLIAVIGWLAYGETLEPTILIGAGVVITGVLINIYAETRAPKEAAKQAAS